MVDFEFLDHTADLKFRARGKTLEKALSTAGLGLTKAILGQNIEGKDSEKELSFVFKSFFELTHDFLSEIIYEIQYNQFIPTGFDIRLTKDAGRMQVTVDGRTFEEDLHEIDQEVKAVTYHNMKVEEVEGVWIIEVICDT